MKFSLAFDAAKRIMLATVLGGGVDVVPFFFYSSPYIFYFSTATVLFLPDCSFLRVDSFRFPAICCSGSADQRALL